MHQTCLGLSRLQIISERSARQRRDRLDLFGGQPRRGVWFGVNDRRIRHACLPRLRASRNFRRLYLDRVQIADGAIVLGQGLIDAARRLQLVVHGLYDFAILGVGEFFLHPLPRNFECGQNRVDGEGYLRRRDAALRDSAVQHVAKSGRGVHQEFGDDVAGDVVEAFLGAHGTLVNIVVSDQLFVIFVREFGGVAGHVIEPARAIGHGDLERGKPGFSDLAQRIVAAVDAPLGGAVNGIFSFRLAGVERHDGIRVVVAEDARCIRRVSPIFGPQGRNRGLIPLSHLFRRAAPVFLPDMQNVVLKILEGIVGCFRAFEIFLDVLQENIAPCLGAWPLHCVQGVERQLVVGAVGVGGVNDPE